MRRSARVVPDPRVAVRPEVLPVVPARITGTEGEHMTDDEMMSPRQFSEVAQRLVLDELQALVLAGHLTPDGLCSLRSRLSSSYEFDPTPRREWLCLRTEEALGMRRAVPGDLSELDELPEPEP